MVSKKSGVDLLLETPELDINLYTGGVRIAAPYMKPLAHVLVNNAPSDSTQQQKKQLHLVVEIAERGDSVLGERQAAVSPIRPAFVSFGSAHGALYDSLVAKARVPASMSDLGPRCSAVLALAYPNGSTFVQRDAHAAWSEGDRLLGFMREHDLENEIGKLIGAEVLSVAERATEELAEALGVGRTRREKPNTTDLQSTVLLFSREVGRYARMLSGDLDLGSPESVERFRKAVAKPIDEFRSRRGVSDTADDTSDDAEGASSTDPKATATGSAVGTVDAPEVEADGTPKKKVA